MIKLRLYMLVRWVLGTALLRSLRVWRKAKRSAARVCTNTRILQHLGYVKEVSVKSTKAGFEATEYELTPRAYVALLLDSVNFEDLLNRTDEDIASEILAAIATLT